MDTAFAIVGYGNPVLDVSVDVSVAELSGLGLRQGAEAPPMDEEARSAVVEFCCSRPDSVRTPGGAALNTVRVAQAIGVVMSAVKIYVVRPFLTETIPAGFAGPRESPHRLYRGMWC